VSVKYGLPPIVGRDARLLILGSLPGDASLIAARYYAHPSNQFWRLLGNALGEPLAGMDYEVRLDCLAKRRVGLWDVIASANRPGSLDGAIREAIHNELVALIAGLPDLKAIAFNGGAAARGGRQLLAGTAVLELIDLPSSSAANTMRFDAKFEQWSRLAQFVLPPHKSA
jgi:hypoxanthine-DNA glycosylase